jgi:threonine/homoserine/homoserine lactone efflux protein
MQRTGQELHGVTWPEQPRPPTYDVRARMSNLPIWSFLAVTVPLVLTPGASTAVVLRNSLSGGIRAGVETAIGTNLGSVCYGFLSAFGLALALRRWPSIWEVLRVGGAAYLAWLGVQSIRRAFGAHRSVPVRQVAAIPQGRFGHTIEGFLTNTLNPAIATFYLIILPQFIPRDAPEVRSALVLTTVHVGLAASWHVTWAAAGGTLAHVLASGAPRRVLDSGTGIALLVLSARMLLQN